MNNTSTATHAPESRFAFARIVPKHPLPLRPHTSHTRSFAKDPFLARFGHALPRALAEEAAGMQWRTFSATYAPTPSHSVQVHSSERIPGLHNRYEIQLHTDAGITSHELMSSGAIRACTEVLADAGRMVEILSFHQYQIFEATVTFILGGNHTSTQRWAMGFGSCPEQSAAAALSAAAQRLYG